MDSSEIIAQYGLNRSKPYGIYNLAEICLFLAGKTRCDIHRDFSPKCMLMKTFFLHRGNARSAKNCHTRNFIGYALYSYGVPALLTCTVDFLDHFDPSINPVGGNTNGTLSPIWRPGFGEESCWFSTCSEGLLLYFYM